MQTLKRNSKHVKSIHKTENQKISSELSALRKLCPSRRQEIKWWRWCTATKYKLPGPNGFPPPFIKHTGLYTKKMW